MSQSFHKIAAQSQLLILTLYLKGQPKEACVPWKKYQYTLKTSNCLKNSSNEKNHLVNMTAQFSCMHSCKTSMSYFFGSLVKTKQLFLSVLVYGRKATFDYSVFKYCFRWLILISSENLNPKMFQKEKKRTSRHKLAQLRKKFCSYLA